MGGRSAERHEKGFRGRCAGQGEVELTSPPYGMNNVKVRDIIQFFFNISVITL